MKYEVGKCYSFDQNRIHDNFTFQVVEILNPKTIKAHIYKSTHPFMEHGIRNIVEGSGAFDFSEQNLNETIIKIFEYDLKVLLNEE